MKNKFFFRVLVILLVIWFASGCAGPRLETAALGENVPLFSFVQLTDTHCTQREQNHGSAPSKYTFFPVTGYKPVQWTDYVNSMSILEKTVEYINDTIKPDFVIHTGDIVHDGRIRSDMEVSKSILSGLVCPVYTVMGNHDVGPSFSNGDSERYNYVQFFGERTYAFDHKGWHFIAIGVSPDNKEMGWLKSELAEQEDVPKVVFTHKLVVADKLTLFLGRKVKHVELMMPRAEEVKTLLESSGKIAMVLSGHCHINLRWGKNNIMYLSTGALTERPHQFRLFKVYPDRIEVSIIRATDTDDVINSRWKSFDRAPIHWNFGNG